MDDSSPEVTISPADNGHVVRWHQRSNKKDEPGRTIKRVASTTDEALGHAKDALGGRTSKKKSNRDGQTAVSDTGDGLTSPVAHSSHSMRGRSARRRPVRSRRRA